MEHYSNFDLPCFTQLLERCGAPYQEVADSVVAVAGVKLNEESKLVLAFTEVFTRVVLYPSPRDRGPSPMHGNATRRRSGARGSTSPP